MNHRTIRARRIKAWRCFALRSRAGALAPLVTIPKELWTRTPMPRCVKRYLAA